jgi:hypothetical protein
MGNLKPHTTYVYEKADGVTYAREFGSEPSTRTPIGWDHDSRTNDGRPIHDHILEAKLWADIRRAARHVPALQDAIERVKVTYYLTEDYEKRYGNRSKT